MMNVWGAIQASTKKLLPEKLQRDGIFTARMILLGIVGIILILAGNFFDSREVKQKEEISAESVKTAPVVNRSYEEVLETKLSNLLSQVKGAGAVAVSVTLEDGATQEYAKNISKESRVIQEKDNGGGTRTTTETKETDQILMGKENGLERPVIAREIKPEIKGVLVIAEGAQDSTVKANLTRAVEAGLGIPAYKITVLAQRK
jgi:stage III sporulation protein AG